MLSAPILRYREGLRLDKILIQPDICDGCLDCEEACKELHGTSRIIVREVEGSYYPIICQHCEDAPCRMICPTEAIDDEKVTPEKCIGCGLCMLVCPFGAMIMHERKAQKCDQCPDLETPACIKACSRRGISILDTDKMSLDKQQQYIKKMAGVDKRAKKGPELIHVLTAGTRAKKALKKEA
jgi:anaerobic carbon-monoxide dehydrogenase iron sulfur subunit